MTLSDDPRDRMARFPSSADAERLLNGELAPDDVSDESVPLARLLVGMRALPRADELTERRVVNEMTALIGSERVVATGRGPRRLSAKAGTLAFVAVLASGTAAAAANGSLPPNIQRTVSDALAHVAISVPHPESHHRPSPKSHDGGPDGSRTNGVAPGSVTKPVAPRGDQHGTDDDSTPRGATTGRSTSTTTVPHDNNGRHVGPPAGVTGPGTTNPNKGPGNDQGLHSGDLRGRHNGDANGKKKTVTTPKPGNGNANANGNGNANANGNGNGSGNGNAGGNGNGNANANANGHAEQSVPGPRANGGSPAS